eukprot:1190097-Prorocentrum_minimum.AAC.2
MHALAQSMAKLVLRVFKDAHHISVSAVSLGREKGPNFSPASFVEVCIHNHITMQLAARVCSQNWDWMWGYDVLQQVSSSNILQISRTR